MAECAFEGPRDSSISARQKQATMQNLPEYFEECKENAIFPVFWRKKSGATGQVQRDIFFGFGKIPAMRCAKSCEVNT